MRNTAVARRNGEASLDVREGINDAIQKTRKRNRDLQQMFEDEVALVAEFKAKIQEAMTGDVEDLVKLMEAHIADNPIKKCCDLNGQLTKNLEAFHKLASKPMPGMADPLVGARRATIVNQNDNDE